MNKLKENDPYFIEANSYPFDKEFGNVDYKVKFN